MSVATTTKATYNDVVKFSKACGAIKTQLFSGKLYEKEVARTLATKSYKKAWQIARKSCKKPYICTLVTHISQHAFTIWTERVKVCVFFDVLVSRRSAK